MLKKLFGLTDEGARVIRDAPWCPEMKEQEQGREEDADAQEQRGDTLGAESFADRGGESAKGKW